MILTPSVRFIQSGIIWFVCLRLASTRTAEKTLDRNYTAPSVAVVGFCGLEGSSWFVDTFKATQNISRNGKVCVMGYEPLDHAPGADSMDEAALKILHRIRWDFYQAFSTISTETPNSYERWSRGLDEILAKGNMKPIQVSSICPRESRLFIFKARMHKHVLNPDNLTANESLQIRQFSRSFKAANGKLILLTRHQMLHRAVSDTEGQFKLKHAKDDDETKEEIKSSYYNISVEYQKVNWGVQKYLHSSQSLENVMDHIQAPRLTLHYETLREEFVPEMTRVLRFLNLPIDYRVSNLLGATEWEKVSPDRLCEKLNDYRDFCLYFRQTQFAGLLDEPCDTACD